MLHLCPFTYDAQVKPILLVIKNFLQKSRGSRVDEAIKSTETRIDDEAIKSTETRMHYM